MDWVGNGDENVGVNPDMERKDIKIENEVRVTVVYNEKEEDAKGYQVYEESSSNEDDSNNDNAHKTDADSPIGMDG